MMGNKDYLSGGVIWIDVQLSQGKLCYEKLDKKNKKKKWLYDYARKF